MSSLEPQITETRWGGWLAVSPLKCVYHIGVIGDTEDDARARFSAALDKWFDPETWPYVWFWKKRPDDYSRKGQRCRVLVRGKMNSATIQFEDGKKFVTSRNGLRRATRGDQR